MPKERIALYVDGFNLYHAIDSLNQNHLKWVNLVLLGNQLIKKKSQKIVRVVYCSAFASHFKNTKKEPRYQRHRLYVKALEAKGVECEMGRFAKRYLKYFGNKIFYAQWVKMEEKQTDVALGTHIINDAHKNIFDTALLMTGDTDLVPTLKIFKKEFPTKKIICVSPPKRSHHGDLLKYSFSTKTIKISQLEKSLFGKRVVFKGTVVARRPPEYKPPA